MSIFGPSYWRRTPVSYGPVIFPPRVMIAEAALSRCMKVQAWYVAGKAQVCALINDPELGKEADLFLAEYDGTAFLNMREDIGEYAAYGGWREFLDAVRRAFVAAEVVLS